MIKTRQYMSILSLFVVLSIVFSGCNKAKNTSNKSHDSDKKIVFENDEYICYESTEYWQDSKAPHPIIEVNHHTYRMKDDREVTLFDVTGKGTTELAEIIRLKLKKEYPELFSLFWNNEAACDGYCSDYYNSLNPEGFDFCLKDDGSIEIYDSWGLDNATNPDGNKIYVVIDGSFKGE